MLDPKKFLFLIKDKIYDMYGITSGLYNSAQFIVDFLCKNGYNSKLVAVVDGNSVDKAVTEFNPDVVILEAIWVTPAKLQELLDIPRHSNRTWVIRIHSKAPFLSNEGMATAWIRDYTRIKTDKIIIAPNTQELTDQFRTCFPQGNFMYFPNLYKDENVASEYVSESGVVNVGCFGAIRPMKNQYLQAMSAIHFANKENLELRFHVNSSRVEQNGGNAMKNIKYLFMDSKHKLIEHPWYDHVNFLKAVSKMDIGVQCSFSESFNIVSADFVAMNKPIIVSNDIEWMPGLLQTDPNKWLEISEKMSFAYSFSGISSFIQKKYLKYYLKKAEKIWLREFCLL